MSDGARIDLHAHSTASDGTDSPADLIAAATHAGLDVVALTDHDTTDGWAAATAVLPPGLTLLPGIELSAAADDDGVPIALHLLGYLVDPADPALVAECAEIRSSRVTRAQRIVEALAEDGVPISWEGVTARAAGTVGRPHIARELVALGLTPTVDAAFSDEWLGQGSRFYRSERKVPVLQAISLVISAGGVPVFAHPGAHGRGATVSDETIAEMAGAGLRGLEIDHPDHDEDTRRHLRGLAGELHLVVTGSSDYHGSSRTFRLGDNLTDPASYEAIVAAGGGSSIRSG